MPTIDPKTGAITLTMEEFAQMQGTPPKGSGEESKSLADRWKEKFAPKKAAAGAPAPAPANGNQQKTQPLTREALYEASKKLSFMDPTPEQMAKIQSGDIATLLEVQQDGLRRVFADSAMASNGLVQNSGQSSKAETEQMIREMLNRHEGARQIQAETGDYLNIPGGDILVSALTQKFSADGTAPSEVGKQVSAYLKDFSSNFGQQANQPSAREVAQQEAQQSATDF